MIAALFVEKNGPYYALDNVDPWDQERDARKYDGPYPVVAHPPCSRWSVLSKLVYSKYPIEAKRPGNDGGCFESALRSVNTYGGVLEHPAKSAAFAYFGINPPNSVGWQQNIDGSWVAQVYQSAYGHLASKLSWLYYVGENPPIDIDMGRPKVDYCVTSSKRNTGLVQMKHSQRHITPIAFRDYLIDLAERATKKPPKGLKCT